MSTSDFSPDHRALPRIFANPKESQLAEITQLLFQSGSKRRIPCGSYFNIRDHLAIQDELGREFALASEAIIYAKYLAADLIMSKFELCPAIEI
jgi:hypothetical protein